MRLALLLLATSALALAAERPNIVLILADDLAWSDLGCYGSTHCETPNLDHFAEQGARFTDAYAAAPICSPSRAALMTGKTPARLGFEFVTKWRDDVMPLGGPRKLDPPPYTYELPLEERTIAEVLRDAGYRTGMVGKWHLNSHHGHYLGWSPTHGPLQQGFQWGRETFGSHPWAYKAAEDPYTDLPEGEYAPDSLTDDAIAFLSQGGDKPFFLYASYPYVHTPVRARGRWLEEKYRAKLGPDATDKRVLYGGFVETFDHNVGRLIDAASRIENTLIVFTSDNGGHPEYAVNAPLRGSKWNLYEGGIRVPLLVRWDGRVKPGWSAARRSPASTGSPRWLKPRARKLLRRIRPACSRCSKEAPHGRSKSGR
ncbi:MAG: sulfatase-like hydrolase/transferase [Bryobacterales bacterium]